MSREKQITILFKKQMQIICRATDKAERDYQIALLAGFLTGLSLTNAITQQDYDRQYKKLQELSARYDTIEAQKGIA